MVSDTDLPDIRSHGSHDPRYFVTKHGRSGNDIVSSKQQVGVTQPRRLHVDEDLAAHWRGNVHVLEIEPLTDCIMYKRLHVWVPTVAFDPA
jgi:hypothetical protein